MNMQINTGIQDYTFNDCVTLRFNPTDWNFANRLQKVGENLDKLQDEVEKTLSENSDISEVLGKLSEMDKDMRGQLETVFGQDIVTPMIGDASVWGWAGGAPVWYNIISAVSDIITKALDEEGKATDERIKKYTQKYKK